VRNAAAGVELFALDRQATIFFDHQVKQKFAGTSVELRANILDFYSDLSVFDKTKHEHDDWNDLLAALEQLKAISLTPAGAAGEKK